ncbi:hypothetical protein BT96DRAFT_918192 [Gymnopus androsaceus JB14]|uniref:PQ-loop-domain-containing protein n=1 Tax=Gymnopus androsaceus JB14 TaxID=1447944 RepID=A0A6A4HXF7_9AGAR|nr:hypothetical protein BT96DRAFT_918192 [Gymnopus androsaceus JB14]
MPVNIVAENVFGTLGTVCWMIQLLPQIRKSYLEKSTVGLSDWMIFSWALGGAFLGTYAVVQNLNIPLIMQPQIFGTLSLISWAQCQYYTRHWSRRNTILIAILTGCILGGFEAGMVFALRSPYNHGSKRAESAIFFFGIMSTVLITGALLPQYYQIYKHKEVIGLSIHFMLIDILGGLFSDLSLIFRPGSFNILAGVTYTLVIVTDGAVVVAAVILNPRARRRRQKAEIQNSPASNTTAPASASLSALPDGVVTDASKEKIEGV